MEHVMVDLETMGTGNNAVILSIGAVGFDKTGVDEEEFYGHITMQSCVERGLGMDTSTVLWWMQQSEAARSELTSPQLIRMDLLPAVLAFDRWLIDHHGRDVSVWGNGATFDNVLLRNAYRVCNHRPCWSFRRDLCFRTLKMLAPDVKPPLFEGTAHNALHDAKYQAAYAVKMLQALA